VTFAAGQASGHTQESHVSGRTSVGEGLQTLAELSPGSEDTDQTSVRVGLQPDSLACPPVNRQRAPTTSPPPAL
jgi:hypothetical protein